MITRISKGLLKHETKKISSRILVKFRYCHLTNQLNTSSKNLIQADQSHGQIPNPDFWLAGQYQICETIVKLIGHMTHLLSNKNSLASFMIYFRLRNSNLLGLPIYLFLKLLILGKEIYERLHDYDLQLKISIRSMYYMSFNQELSGFHKKSVSYMKTKRKPDK